MHIALYFISSIAPPNNQPAPQQQPQQPTQPTWYGFSAPPDQQPQQPGGYGQQGWNGGGYAQPPPYGSCQPPGCVPGQPYGGQPGQAQGYAVPYGGFNPSVAGGFMQPGFLRPDQPNGYPGSAPQQQPNGYPGSAPPQQQQPQQPPAGAVAGAVGGAAAPNFMGFSLPPGSEYS